MIPSPQRSNAAKALAFVLKLQAQVEKSAGKGLDAAARFLASRTKETLSEPAPRQRTKDALGNIGYRATTRATPGAPPRKLSGRLRNSVGSMMRGPCAAVVFANAKGLPSTKWPGGFPYPMYHELQSPAFRKSGQHPFFAPTAKAHMKDLRKIVGQAVKVGVES